MSQQRPGLEWLDSLDDAIDWIVFLLGVISIACCAALLMTFYFFRKLRTFAVSLICWLSLTIMLAMTFFLMTFEVNDINASLDNAQKN